MTHIQTWKIQCVSHSSQMQVAAVDFAKEDLHQILVLTSVEAEEWGVGWQVRRWAHEFWWMNFVLSGVIPKPRRGMCNRDILSCGAVTWNILLIDRTTLLSWKWRGRLRSDPAVIKIANIHLKDTHWPNLRSMKNNNSCNSFWFQRGKMRHCQQLSTGPLS